MDGGPNCMNTIAFLDSFDVVRAESTKVTKCIPTLRAYFYITK